MFECARALTHGCELNVFLAFNTTYLCEITFSAINIRLSLRDVEEILHPAVSNLAPRFNLLSSKKQAHQFHEQTILSFNFCIINQLTTAFFVTIMNTILRLIVQFLILHFCMFLNKF